ncbi:MAG: lipoprotein [Pseudomonadota bacterium]
MLRMLPWTLLFATLAACGQKGPLYLPDDVEPAPAVATPAEDDDETDES